MIEFDTETRGLQWYYEAQRMFLAQFLWPNDGTSLLRHPEDSDAIQGWLNERQSHGFRAWNTKFDLHHLKAAGYDLPNEHAWHDGMVMAHVIDERPSIALQARAEAVGIEDAREPSRAKDAWLDKERRQRRKEAKDAGVEYVPPNYADVPMEIMGPYAAGDVEQQEVICRNFERIFRQESDLASVYELERGVLRALFWTEERGLPIDRAAAVRFENQVLIDLERLERECIALAGIKTFNPASSDQVYEALKRRGADLRFITVSAKTKKPSMDAENLDTVHDDLAAKVREFRGTKKLLSTYLHPMLHSRPGKFGPDLPFLTPEDRIHPNFRQVGAKTARMSCSEPNVQNWHRDDLRLRHLIAPTEGKVLVCCDLDAIEMRLLAMFAGPGRLRQMIREGVDMHSDTANEVGLDDFDRGGGVIEPKRQRGKTFNYAVSYGAGVRRIRKWNRDSQAEARAKLDRYYAAYPEIAVLKDNIEMRLYDRGYIKSPWGRRYRLDARTEAHRGIAHLIQGTAADLFKDSLVKVHDAGVPVIGVFHDEIVAECDPGDAEEIGKVIRSALISHPRITEHVPLDADFKTVARLSYAKNPDYVPPYDA